MSVRDGRIALPDGMSYRMLVLPERETIDLEALRKIARLVKAGATVVGPKPCGPRGCGITRTATRSFESLPTRSGVPATARRSANIAMARDGSSAASRRARACGRPA